MHACETHVHKIATYRACPVVFFFRNLNKIIRYRPWMIFFCSYFLVESLLPLKILFRLYMLRVSTGENIIIVKKTLISNLVMSP